MEYAENTSSCIESNATRHLGGIFPGSIRSAKNNMLKWMGYLLGALALVASLLFPSSSEASLQFLDNNSNYPVSYYHAAKQEYVDLTSCVHHEDEWYHYYATGYIEVNFDTRSYKVRKYRQSKDGTSSPQFYNDYNGNWVTMPFYDLKSVRNYIATHGYMGYISTYHAYQYYMFKIVYKKIIGVEYPDTMEGEIE